MRVPTAPRAPRARLALRTLAVALLLGLLVAATAACAPEPTPISGHPKVRIEVEGGYAMTLELYPEFAPKTVANFLSLVDAGFYDGLAFHRVIKDNFIQGNDPKGDGTGGSDQRIKGEFSENGFSQNTLSHTFGTISMARSTDRNSATSQFFIVACDNNPKAWDGKYAAFGRLVDGTNDLIALSRKPVEANASGEVSKPVDPIVIVRIVRVDDAATPTPAT